MIKYIFTNRCKNHASLELMITKIDFVRLQTHGSGRLSKLVLPLYTPWDREKYGFRYYSNIAQGYTHFNLLMLGSNQYRGGMKTIIIFPKSALGGVIEVA